MMIAWLQASSKIWPNALLQWVSLGPLDVSADESGILLAVTSFSYI